MKGLNHQSGMPIYNLLHKILELHTFLRSTTEVLSLHYIVGRVHDKWEL